MSPKKLLFVTYMTTLITGCEEPSNPDYDMDIQAAPTDREAPPEEASPPIEVSVVALSGTATTYQKDITLELTNTLPYRVTMSLELICEGLLNRTATLDAGVITLLPNARTVTTVPASRIPLQTSNNVGHAHFVATSLGQDVTEAVHSETFYYRHNRDFQSVSVFDENVLIRDLNGTLTIVDESPLGRIVSEDGSVTEIVTANNNTVLLDAEGKPAGRLIELGINTDSAEQLTETPSAQKDHALSPRTGATGSLKICSNWKTHYTDAGGSGKEDVFWGQGERYRPAVYTVAKIQHWENSNWKTVWSGTLDISGCMTEYLNVIEGDKYRFKQGTYVKKNYRKVFLEPANADWGPVFTWLNSTLTAEKGTHTVTLTPNWLTVQSNGAVVGAHILAMSSDLDFNPSNLSIYVKSHSVSKYDLVCNFPSYKGSASNNSYAKVCFPDNAWGKKKFALAHEIGHAIADVNDGPISGSTWYQDSNLENYCRSISNNRKAYDHKNHHLHSLELTGGAAKEGFAHFFSVAAFNKRNENDAVLYYSKRHWDTTPGGGYTYSQCNNWTPSSGNPVPSGCFMTESFPDTSIYIDATTDFKWAESHCNPGRKDLSSELDWIVFFWKIYHGDGRHQLDIGEINDIWAATSSTWLCCPSNTDVRNYEDCCETASPHSTSCPTGMSASVVGDTWDELLDSVESLYDSEIAEFFEQAGIEAGVDHSLRSSDASCQ